MAWGAKFCAECGHSLIAPAPEPDPALVPAVHVHTHIAAPTSDPDLEAVKPRHPRALTDMDADELEALEKVIAARRSPIDRWIVKILGILAVLVTGYFGTRAETGISSMESTGQEIALLTDTTDRLEELLTDADDRIEEMDDARAQELTALRAVVQRLERSLRLMILNNLVRQAATPYMAEVRGSPGVLRIPEPIAELTAHREIIIDQVQVQTQQQFPYVDEDEARELAGAAVDRYIEQAQEQAQEQR